MSDPGPTNNELTPTFILGVPRSGTTLLRVLLDSHSDIAAPSETPWVLGGYSRTSIRDLMTGLCEEHSAPCNNLIGVDQDLIYRCGRRMVSDILQANMAARNKSIAVLKTPDDVRFLEFLFQFYPKTSYVHIYRDGRDVACSTVRKRAVWSDDMGEYGRITYINVVRRWYDWESKIRTFLASHDVRHITISYEQLVLEPARTMQSVCQFLGVDYQSQMLDYASFQHELPQWEAGSNDVREKQRIESTSIGVWKKQIPPKSLAIIHQHCGFFLKQLGYDSPDTGTPQTAQLLRETFLGDELRHWAYARLRPIKRKLIG